MTYKLLIKLLLHTFTKSVRKSKLKAPKIRKFKAKIVKLVIQQQKGNE